MAGNKCPARTMGWKHKLFLQLSLRLARWLLGCEIKYLHERFRAAGQTGDMTVDIESLHADLNEYLGGERFRANPPRDPIDLPMADGEGEEEGGADDPSDGGDNGGDDGELNGIVNMNLSGQPLRLNMLNGRETDHPPETADDGSDAEMAEERGESLEEHHVRYLNSSQDEVSEPDEQANVYYGHMDRFAYERMVAYSRANRMRLDRAAGILRNRHDAAAVQGNWEEAAQYLRALNEVEAPIYGHCLNWMSVGRNQCR